jgi:ABC-2 type transport system ATP-binding protein
MKKGKVKMSLSEYVIETHHLTKLYEGNKGFHDISLQVPRGIVFGFLGPNGAGKSTFVRTLLALLHPTRGTASILGHPIASTASRKRVGYLPELFRYPDWLTGKKLLELHADLCKLPTSERKKRIHTLLERVGLHRREDEKIRGYSKGMQQRIGLACALISDPEVLFLDEPTSALDPIGRKEMRELIADLRDQGKTIFLNSHLLQEVENVCNDVAIIDHGKLLVQGDWRQLSAINTRIEVALSSMEDSHWQKLSHLITQRERLTKAEGKSAWLLTLPSEKQIPILVSALTSLQIEVFQVTPRLQSLEELFMYWIQQREVAQDVDHCQINGHRDVS